MDSVMPALEAQKKNRRGTKKTDRPWNLPRIQGTFRMDKGNSNLITFHVNYKEDVFGLGEFEIKKINLTLVRVDSSKTLHKGKTELTFSKSKYSYLKHLPESNTLHFYHRKCQLNLVNNV